MKHSNFIVLLFHGAKEGTPLDCELNDEVFIIVLCEQSSWKRLVFFVECRVINIPAGPNSWASIRKEES